MLDPYAQDPAFREMTLVLDFEGTTPTGFPAEPIEVGAVLLRLVGVELVEASRFEALMRPPEHAPMTAFGTRQNGITAAMVAGQPTADTVLADFDASLTANRYITVAHHASTEAGILARYAHACPRLAAAPYSTPSAWPATPTRSAAAIPSTRSWTTWRSPADLTGTASCLTRS